MATEKINLLQVSLDVDMEKRTGGTYKAHNLVYKDSRGQLREKAIPMAYLKFYPTLKEAIEHLEAGQSVTLTTEKQENGFVNVVGINDTIVKTVETPAKPASSFPSKKTTSYNSYNTEERDASIAVLAASKTASLALSNKVKEFEKMDLLTATRHVLNINKKLIKEYLSNKSIESLDSPLEEVSGTEESWD